MQTPLPLFQTPFFCLLSSLFVQKHIATKKASNLYPQENPENEKPKISSKIFFTNYEFIESLNV
jgi:hypothetical protein